MSKKIIISLIMSFMFTLLLVNTIFFREAPRVNSVKLARMAKNIRDEVTIFKNTITYKLSSNKIDYDQVFNEANMTFEFDEEIITLTPTPTMGEFVFPTDEPDLLPTEPIEEPTPFISDFPEEPVPTEAPDPTRIPTAKPTKPPKATPTQTPEPTSPPKNNPLFISNPLDQPYYNPRLAYKCYNADKFIEVYGGGNPGSCYANAKKYVDSHMTSVTIMGKTIPVHEQAYPYFHAVAERLKNYKGYKINNIGSYVFRCNVNASSVDRFDLCAEGCVLSTHAFGIAVDINSVENCNGCSNFDMPPEVVDAFEAYGFRWGGRYKSIFGSTIDAMHFELMVDLCRDVE